MEYNIDRPYHSIVSSKFGFQRSQESYSSIRQDLEDIFKQLSTWSGHVSDLKEWMGQERKFKRNRLYGKN